LSEEKKKRKNLLRKNFPLSQKRGGEGGGDGYFAISGR